MPHVHVTHRQHKGKEGKQLHYRKHKLLSVHLFPILKMFKVLMTLRPCSSGKGMGRVYGRFQVQVSKGTKIHLSKKKINDLTTFSSYGRCKQSQTHPISKVQKIKRESSSLHRDILSLFIIVPAHGSFAKAFYLQKVPKL